MKKVGVGVIGCGVISGVYSRALGYGSGGGEARAGEFGLKPVSVEALLADPGIEIILNLTIPKAHVAVGLQALDAGKHVDSEKPLGVAFKDGRKLQ
jgi:predicted dehydrogenase